MATVTHTVRADGSHEIGVKDGGVFVPLVTVDAARFEQLREYADNRPAENGDDTDEPSKGGKS